MIALRTQPNGNRRRTRHGAPWTSLPTLRPAQQALLCDWLRADAAERQWQSLLDIAGAQRLELAEGLLDLLLHAGALHTKERFIHAQWRVERIVWSDVAVLQEAVGLRSAATREELGAWTTSNSNALGTPGERIFAYKEWQTNLSYRRFPDRQTQQPHSAEN